MPRRIRVLTLSLLALAACEVTTPTNDPNAPGAGAHEEILGDDAAGIDVGGSEATARPPARSIGDLSDGGAPPDTSSASSTSKTGDGDARVEPIGESRWAVDRWLLDEALQDTEKLASQVRAVPHRNDAGDIDGYRLSGIRRDSLFGRLGIENGDIVHAVNGISLTTADGALKAHQSLQGADGFDVDITRRNQKQTFNYEIRSTAPTPTR